MKRLFTVIFLLMWSVGTVASAHAEMSVICFGKDGHRSVENGLGADCVDTMGLSAFDASTFSVSAPILKVRNCGGCIDYPMASSVQAFSPSAAAPVTPPGLVAIVPIALILASAADNSQSAVFRAAAAPPDPRSRYISHRKTIVILT